MSLVGKYRFFLINFLVFEDTVGKTETTDFNKPWG